MTTKQSSNLDARLIMLLRAEKHIAAIKLHREETGSSLYDAKRDIDNLRDSISAEGRTCGWILWDGDQNVWNTQCGEEHVITIGGPSANRMSFCCYCGLPLAEAQKGRED